MGDGRILTGFTCDGQFPSPRCHVESPIFGRSGGGQFTGRIVGFGAARRNSDPVRQWSDAQPRAARSSARTLTSHPSTSSSSGRSACTSASVSVSSATSPCTNTPPPRPAYGWRTSRTASRSAVPRSCHVRYGPEPDWPIAGSANIDPRWRRGALSDEDLESRIPALGAIVSQIAYIARPERT